MKQQFDFSQLNFDRIAVIGSAGSGKTTFSKSLGQLLNKEVVHLDKILWGENWTELTYEQQVEILTPIVEKEVWLIDGTWAKTLSIRYQRATLVIFLDYKPSFCAWRAFWRSVKHGGKQRDDLALGCVERINLPFYRYILDFNKNTRPKIEAIQGQNPNVMLLTLKTPKQTKLFLQELENFLQK